MSTSTHQKIDKAHVQKPFGLVLMGLGFVILVLTNSNVLPDMNIIFRVALGGLSFLLLGSGASLYNKGRKMEAVNAATVSARDQRPPVLYLRSFQDDVPSSQSVHVMVATTEEEQIAEVMNEIGPFIAIGKPGEALPELGAARFYVGDEWQKKIRELLAQAQLVVLRGGATEGLIWEVHTAVEIVKPERLIILVPEDERQLVTFRRLAENYLPKKLPERLDKSQRPIWTSWSHNLRGLVYFDPDWTAHYIQFKPSGRIDRQMSDALKKSLSPVITRLNLTWRPRARLKLGFILLLIFLALLIVCMISVLISDMGLR